MNKVTIGDNAKIQNNVAVRRGGARGGCVLRPSMVFTNVYNPRSAVSRKDEYRRTLVRRGAIRPTPPSCAGDDRTLRSSARAVINRDVPDYALMAGVPARRIGWMSEAGYRLVPLDGAATAPADGVERLRCEGTGALYERRGDVVVRLEEQA